MAGTLIFTIDDEFKSMVEHAAANDPGPFYGTKIDRSMFLVKDRGAYLMSGGQPRQMREDGKGCVVQYAHEHNPETGSYDYDFTRQVCGGDDFVEPLGLKFFQDAIADGRTKIHIKLTANQIAMEAK